MTLNFIFLFVSCLVVPSLDATLSQDRVKPEKDSGTIKEATERIQQYFQKNFGLNEPSKLLDKTGRLADIISDIASPTIPKLRSALMAQLKSIIAEKKEDSKIRYRIHFVIGLLVKAKTVDWDKFKALLDGYPLSKASSLWEVSPKEQIESKIAVIKGKLFPSIDKATSSDLNENQILVLKIVSATAWEPRSESKLEIMNDLRNLITGEQKSDAADLTRELKNIWEKVFQGSVAVAELKLIHAVTERIKNYFQTNFAITADFSKLLDGKQDLESALIGFAKMDDKQLFEQLKPQLQMIVKEDESKDSNPRYRIHFVVGLVQFALLEPYTYSVFKELINGFPDSSTKGLIQDSIAAITKVWPDRSVDEQILILKSIAATAWTSSQTIKLEMVQRLQQFVADKEEPGESGTTTPDVSLPHEIPQPLSILWQSLLTKRERDELIRNREVGSEPLVIDPIAPLIKVLQETYGYSDNEIGEVNQNPNRVTRLKEMIEFAEKTQSKQLVQYSKETFWGSELEAVGKGILNLLPVYRQAFKHAIDLPTNKETTLLSGENSLKILMNEFMQNGRVKRERIAKSMERVRTALSHQVGGKTLVELVGQCAGKCMGAYSDFVADVADIVDSDSDRNVDDIVSVWSERVMAHESKTKLDVAILKIDGADKFKKVQAQFNQIVNEYFRYHFGTAGYLYLRSIATETFFQQSKSPELKLLIEKSAKKTIAKFTGKRFFGLFGNKKTTQISFRLHRLIGAFRLPGFSGATNEATIKKVLTGATKFKMSVPKKIIEVIKSISSIPNGRMKLRMLQLIGAIAKSENPKPVFQDLLFDYAKRIVDDYKKEGEIRRFGIESLVQLTLVKLNELKFAEISSTESDVVGIVKSHFDHLKTMTHVATVARNICNSLKKKCGREKAGWDLFEAQIKRSMGYFFTDFSVVKGLNLHNVNGDFCTQQSPKKSPIELLLCTLLLYENDACSLAPGNVWAVTLNDQLTDLKSSRTS